MQNRSHAYLCASGSRTALPVMMQYYATWAQNVSVRMTGMGICHSSSIIVLPVAPMYDKGVCPMERQIPISDTQVMTVREEGVSPGPTVMNCLVVYMIFVN